MLGQLARAVLEARLTARGVAQVEGWLVPAAQRPKVATGRTGKVPIISHEQL